MAMIVDQFVSLEPTWAEQQATPFFNVRLPRVPLALMVGCCLAVAGAAHRGTFQNPLVSPRHLRCQPERQGGSRRPPGAAGHSRGVHRSEAGRPRGERHAAFRGTATGALHRNARGRGAAPTAGAKHPQTRARHLRAGARHDTREGGAYGQGRSTSGQELDATRENAASAGERAVRKNVPTCATAPITKRAVSRKIGGPLHDLARFPMLRPP